MKREQKMGLVGLALTSFLLVTPIFQNCAKVNYQTTDPATVQKVAGATIRKITVDPTFNQQKADMKVLFVVDDSYTMSQSQTQLANAVDSLLTPLQGHNVEFKIVSTSGVPSNEVDYTLTTKYFSEQNIEIPQSQLAGATTYLVEKNVKNALTKRHGLLKLYRESTTSQLNSLKAQIKSAIQGVGVAGSDTEEGLCAVNRQIYDETSSRFFNPGDKGAIVILTDEDDSSVFNKCSSRYRQRVSAKPVVYYNYGQQRAQLTLEYQINRDGIIAWQPLVYGVGLSGQRTINPGDVCSANDQSEAVQKMTTQGFIIRNVTKCIYDVIQASYYGADLGDDGSVPNKNLCSSSITFNGRVYADLYAMVNSLGYSGAPNSCSKQSIAGNSLTAQTEFDSIIRSDNVANNAQDLKLSILNKATEVFGANGFIVASLIRQNSESCSLATGQSYGLKYQELNQLLGPDKSVAQSLCNTNFSTTLAQVSQFIVTEASNSFVVPIQDGESVLSVTLIRNGQRTLLTKSEYEAVHGSVTLLNKPLLKGDTLEIELGSGS